MKSRSRFRRNILLCSFFTTPDANPAIKEGDEDAEYDPARDIPFGPDPIFRAELSSRNTARYWPSVGGLIVNEHLTSVEVNFFKLSRFVDTPRPPRPVQDPDEEDAFCGRLRLTGARWWRDYSDFDWAIVGRMRGVSKQEREALVLGWDNDAGVWVIREENRGDIYQTGRWMNAHTMEERWRAMNISGAVYHANPEDREPVKVLMDGFGEHEEEPPENYYYDNPRDYYRLI
ncbi:hypothetical protein VTL71DRAFT_6408 [Oculimacula yallundae]|uniref:Uncharacterized protein n=1 Tax=Oculimacula yallundae TaxID=86028 RepID=A0ABR4BXL3_9HELO